MTVTWRRRAAGSGIGVRERVDAGGDGGRRKRPRRRLEAPGRPGEDAVERPAEAGASARLDDPPARHRARLSFVK